MVDIIRHKKEARSNVKNLFLSSLKTKSIYTSFCKNLSNVRLFIYIYVFLTVIRAGRHRYWRGRASELDSPHERAPRKLDGGAMGVHRHRCDHVHHRFLRMLWSYTGEPLHGCHGKMLNIYITQMLIIFSAYIE